MQESKLHQINVTFQPVEDRLFLRINMKQVLDETITEVRLWLTRRYVRLLWSVLEKLVEEDIARLPQVTQTNKQVFKKLQQQSDIAQSDFSTPYTLPDAPPTTPWGDAPLLLSKIQVRKDPNGSSLLYLGSEDNKGIHLNMNSQLVNSFMKLLADTAEKAQWDLPFQKVTAVQHERPPMNKLM